LSNVPLTALSLNAIWAGIEPKPVIDPCPSVSPVSFQAYPA
jgi:hypothetical protein